MGNWLEVWSIVPLARFFGNTAVVTFFALIGQLLSSSLVAYGFARFRFPFRNLLFLMVLSVLMLPPIVYLIPQYALFNRIGWIDTFLPLIVPWWFSAGSGGAFSIFLLRQFYSTIPREMDEAAMIDGAGYFTIWWRIILPLSKPALAALTIFGFVWHWNDFLEPLIYLQSTENFTISVGLQFLQTAGFTGFGASPITEHYLMAAALLACLPPLVLFLIAQRWFIEGINLTGTKG
jgi:multiple sugar transport system permease protein